jgi:hypothetical protein
VCQQCGHVGCCDSSPNRHATVHHRETDHPVIRSFEPGEEWFWCSRDEVAFELADVPPGPSTPEHGMRAWRDWVVDSTHQMNRIYRTISRPGGASAVQREVSRRDGPR